MQRPVDVWRELGAEFTVEVIQATRGQWPELIHVPWLVNVALLGFVRWSKWELAEMRSAMTRCDLPHPFRFYTDVSH